jgi:lysozyme family protein
MNITKMLNDLIKIEAGYVDHPADKGGPTKYGITLPALNEYTGRRNTKSDIQALTEPIAKDIYLKLYYNKPKINQLPNMIQPLVFDMAVNHGRKTAIQLMQSQLLADGFAINKVDGVIGPLTLDAAGSASIELGPVFINNLVNRRIARYKAIIKHDPTQKVFEKGWLTRAEIFRPEVVA